MTSLGRPAGGRLILLVLLTCLLWLSAGGIARAQQASVHAQLGRSTITIEETVRLAIVASDIDGELDTSALEADFEIVGRSSSRDVSILNGKRRVTVQWVLELRPREVGVFTVPPVSVAGVESELLTLTVNKAPIGADRDIFVEAEVDEMAPYVQSQVILTLRVFRAIDIIDGSLGEPAVNDIEVRPFGDRRQYSELRDGRNYLVDERRFALFPQRSGRLTVPPIGLSVSVAADSSRVRGFFAPTRNLNRRTRPLVLDVQARPPATHGWWLPATAVELSDVPEATSGGQMRVGEPFTRTIRLIARGALDTQLPDIAAPTVDGLSIYADDPVRDSRAVEEGIESSQTLSLAIIPDRSGRFELPAVRVAWFDVTAGEARTAELPARTVDILPSAGGSRDAAALPAEKSVSGESEAESGAVLRRDADNALMDSAPLDSTSDGEAGALADTEAATSDADTTVSGLIRTDGANGGVSATWRWLALLAVIAWLLTGIAWLRDRRRLAFGDASGSAPIGDTTPRPLTSATKERRALELAIQDRDVAAASRAVLARGAVVWPASAPRSLGELAQRLDAERPLRERLAAIDAARFRATPAGDGVGLADVVRPGAAVDGLANAAVGGPGGTAPAEVRPMLEGLSSLLDEAFERCSERDAQGAGSSHRRAALTAGSATDIRDLPGL